MILWKQSISKFKSENLNIAAISSISFSCFSMKHYMQYFMCSHSIYINVRYSILSLELCVHECCPFFQRIFYQFHFFFYYYISPKTYYFILFFHEFSVVFIFINTCPLKNNKERELIPRGRVTDSQNKLFRYFSK